MVIVNIALTLDEAQKMAYLLLDYGNRLKDDGHKAAGSYVIDTFKRLQAQVSQGIKAQVAAKHG